MKSCTSFILCSSSKYSLIQDFFIQDSFVQDSSVKDLNVSSTCNTSSEILFICDILSEKTLFSVVLNSIPIL